MIKSVWWSIAIVLLLAMPELVMAQPVRQMPGTRPYLPGSPPINQVPLNPRTRAAANAIGVESTDFYGKKGYPKQLGDASESQTTGGAASGVSAAGGLSGGVSSTGGLSGLSGGGGGLSGGLSGGGGLGGGGGGGVNRNGFSNGITGGGFSGLVPKGFGFGGTPAFDYSSLHGNSR